MAKIATIESKSASKSSGASSSQQDLQAQISQMAYQFFAERGYQHGYDAEDWVRAESILKNKKK